MQKLSVSEEEQMSRKEYLKNKRKQEKNMNFVLGKFSIKRLLIILLIILLLVYICIQFYIYYRQNNYSYLSDENVENQKVYNVYYMSDGYTYNPSSSLNSIKSNSFELTRLCTDLGFEEIKITGRIILGKKDNLLYSYDLDSEVITKIYDDEISKYTCYENEVYIIDKDVTKVIMINIDTNEKLEFEKKDVTEILVDKDYVFLCIEDKNKKYLYRYGKKWDNESKLTDSETISYIIQDEFFIYFVNKADENKIYKVHKEGGVEKLADDVKSISDTGDISDIDGNKYMYCYNNCVYYINTSDNDTLWKFDLETKENTKVLYSAIDILQGVENTVFYKIKNERGLLLYNLETGFNSEVSSRLITEFVVEK